MISQIHQYENDQAHTMYDFEDDDLKFGNNKTENEWNRIESLF